MSFVVYDVKSLKILRIYPTLRGAKIAAVCANKREKLYLQKKLARGVEITDWDRQNLRNYVATDAATFNSKVDHQITVKNLMSGKEVTIMASQAGGCCDPSTETYWSM